MQQPFALPTPHITRVLLVQDNPGDVRLIQENGRYPATLDQLSPRYLLIIPPPVVLRRQSWCYQGGDRYFRLGYVSGRFTYFEATFFDQTHAMAGAVPVADWECTELARRYQRGELLY